MKKILSTISAIIALSGLMLIQGACTDDLLDQRPTTEVPLSNFWLTEADATIGLMGAYASVRPLFDRDYYFDGQGEFVRDRNATNSIVSGTLRLGDAYHGSGAASGFVPSGYGASFDKMFRYLYGGVNRTNYVIEHVRMMLPKATSDASRAKLETIIGEARLLRGMMYFRLITMWGDVPYIYQVVDDNDAVATVSRTPIAVVKDSIMADFTYAFAKLPAVKPDGRAGKTAALAFRGKLQLYWACWNNFGWPELTTFTPDQAAATVAYAGAAADFKAVIEDYGLTLYGNGDPGQMDALGKADVLPKYYSLFLPAANNDKEIIMSFVHGGTGTSQSEELMRDFAGRTHESGQCWITPRYELADRYQLTTTGDFAPKLVPMANTPANRNALNSAINPQSYANRDYRMKSSILWENEVIIGLRSLKSTGFIYFFYTFWTGATFGGVNYPTYNTDGCNTGYVFRKFVRNYPGQGRSDGDFNWPVMRLADVYLMYAEATNELSGPQADAIDLVNKVRQRGNLPALGAAKTAGKAEFFDAIEQERIVELVAEGHRGFDLRRWRALERVWGAPGGSGVQTKDTFGANRDVFYRNTPARTYEQNYIFRIPPNERDRNKNLTQNTPWL